MPGTMKSMLIALGVVTVGCTLDVDAPSAEKFPSISLSSCEPSREEVAVEAFLKWKADCEATPQQDDFCPQSDAELPYCRHGVDHCVLTQCGNFCEEDLNWRYDGEGPIFDDFECLVLVESSES